MDPACIIFLVLLLVCAAAAVVLAVVCLAGEVAASAASSKANTTEEIRRIGKEAMEEMDKASDDYLQQVLNLAQGGNNG